VLREDAVSIMPVRRFACRPCGRPVRRGPVGRDAGGRDVLRDGGGSTHGSFVALRQTEGGGVEGMTIAEFRIAIGVGRREIIGFGEGTVELQSALTIHPPADPERRRVVQRALFPRVFSISCQAYHKQNASGWRGSRGRA
jgi:hypothetical protein